MSAVYIATGHVRHLAAWTADQRVLPGQVVNALRLGRYRAICGTPTRTTALLVSDVDITPEHEALFDVTYLRQMRAAKGRPVCRWCTTTLQRLVELAGVTS